MKKTLYLSIYKQNRQAADKLKLDYALDNQAFSWDDPIYLINIGELDLRQRAVVMRILKAIDGYYTRKSDVTVVCDSLSAYAILESSKRLGFSITPLGDEDLNTLMEGIAQHSGKSLPSFYQELGERWPLIEAARIEEEKKIKKQQEEDARRKREEEDARRKKDEDERKKRLEEEAKNPQKNENNFSEDYYTPAFNVADANELLNAQLLPAYIKLLVLEKACQKKAVGYLQLAEQPSNWMQTDPHNWMFKKSLEFVKSDIKDIIKTNTKINMFLETTFHQMRTPVPRVAFQKNKGWGDYLFDFLVALGQSMAEEEAGAPKPQNFPTKVSIPKPDKNASMDMLFSEQKDVIEVTLEVLESQEVIPSLLPNLKQHVKILKSVKNEVQKGLRSAETVKFHTKRGF